MNQKLIERMRTTMAEKGISQAELAKRTKIRASSISDYLNNRYEPKQDKIYLMAEALGVNPAWLSGRDNDVPTKKPWEGLKNIVPPEEMEIRKVPLLGTIAAGRPILCNENIEMQLPCDVPSANFALRIKGDSMINANYFDGDIVFIHQQPVVDDGQIAAVRIDDSATLKRFRRIPGGCILLPENPEYESMTFTADNCDDIAIIGVPVAKFTKYIAH